MNGDFEEHNRTISISGGKFEMKDTTFPYGFVPPNARVWFQKFQDDGVVHEYLMTEGYLWTGQYPAVQRVIDHGNNQSMELNEENLKGKRKKTQFIILTTGILNVKKIYLDTILYHY